MPSNANASALFAAACLAFTVPVVGQESEGRVGVPCAHNCTEHTTAYYAQPRAKISDSALKITQVGDKSGITWNLIFNDTGTGIGFDDPVRGAQRRQIVTGVIDYLDSVLNHPGSRCDIVFKNSNTGGLAGGGFLAFATPLFIFQPGFSAGTAHSQIVNGQDLLPSNPDIEITFDFGYNWNEDLSPPASNEFDLFTVALHEIVHGLGLISVTNQLGQSTVHPGLFSTFDQRLYTVSPFERLWNDQGQISNVSYLSGGPGTVVFVGEEANEALGFNPFIFAQDDFEENAFLQGVTITHWQLAAPNPPISLMGPIFFSGDSIRTFKEFELGALRDLGYKTKRAVPTLTPELAGPLLEGTPPIFSADYNGDEIVDAADVISTAVKSAPFVVLAENQ